MRKETRNFRMRFKETRLAKNPGRMGTNARRQFSEKREAVLNRSTLYPHSPLDYHSFPPSLTRSLSPSFLPFQRLNWALQIRGVSPEDAGRYECQATTHPPQNIVVKFRVVGKKRTHGTLTTADRSDPLSVRLEVPHLYSSRS